MKVLLFTNTDWSLYNFRLPLAKELRKMGHNIVMISPKGEFVNKIEQEGFRHISVSLNRTGMNPIKEVYTIKELKCLFNHENPDIIHNFTPKGVLYGSTAAKWAGLSCVVNSITGLGYMFESDRKGIKALLIRRFLLKWYKLALSRTKVIFQNEEDLHYLSGKGILTNSKVDLIRSSGVNVSKFVPEYPKSGRPIVGLPARMVRAKGVETFIKAAEILKEEHDLKARFVLAGDVDPTREDSLTEEELRDWEDEGVIEWWGYQDDMPDFYKKASIICLPSYGKEGVPRTLIEAASSGKPIITTDNTGCRDAVIDGETGYIIPVKNAEILSKKIKHLVNNQKLGEKMGKKGREFAEKMFAMDIIAQMTENVYSDNSERILSN